MKKINDTYKERICGLHLDLWPLTSEYLSKEIEVV